MQVYDKVLVLTDSNQFRKGVIKEWHPNKKSYSVRFKARGGTRHTAATLLVHESKVFPIDVDLDMAKVIYGA